MRKDLKGRAILLRKEGRTYREILHEVPVAKSTLSLWLRSVGLSVPQQQRITQARIDAALRGAQSRRRVRLKEVSDSVAQGIKDVGTLSNRELWLIGIALHWSEGSKQNLRSPSAGVAFANMDPRMLSIFLAWLESLGVKEEDIRYELYIHIDRREETSRFREWWSEKLSIPVELLGKVYLKQGNVLTKRTNVGDLYHGLLRIKVKSSTNLNRRIHGWFEGIASSVGSGVTGNTPAFEAGDSRIVP